MQNALLTMDINQKRLKSLEKPPMTRKTMDEDEDDRGDCDVIDRISNLPDELLCHILSFLPTKKAVATAILSTKWKNLFPLIPNLQLKLNDILLLQPEKSSLDVIFMNFVDRLLNVTLRDNSSVSTFHLILQKIDEGREIGNWISSALRLNVKKMDIRNRRLKNSNFVLDSLFGCNLVSLTLMLDFADEAPECRFSLPNLQMLCVQNMQFKVVNILLEGCPSLEHLFVYNCYCYPGEMLRICLPSLKALKLFSYIYFLEGEVELDVPKLEYFNYCGFLANRYTGKKMKSLRIARFDLYQNVSQYTYESDEQAAELIKLCSGAEKLWLSEKFIMMLHHLPGPMPRFQNLVVILIKNIDSCGWKLIPSLLESAPNLETLIVKSGFENESYERLKAFLEKSLSICLSQCRDKCYVMKIERGVGN
ncbi:hypothetical protein BUALT_Bualt07G0130700 [Buddleja alternifolia]|uniref:F-box domain-containing protein n=1 Tax=Buddleja alternifolia TaxID=168488 RepID=A0AAV6XET3_9LAMI|nr:hypothetical protein BUALT_Bualt07G0130700 [Buddleja alternifolia]